MIAFRDAGNDHRFFDIQFASLQADPFPVLADLYAFLGEDFTAQVQARMEAKRRHTPHDEHGYQRTGMEEFGLDRALLRERFVFYAERFGLPSGPG